MSKDLLSEAIADAKAIREVALENAKASIAETFAPQIKSMISTRLQEEESIDDDEDMHEMNMFEEEEEEMKEEYVFEEEDEDMEMEEGEDMEMEEGEDMEMEEGEDMEMEEGEDMEMEEGEDYSLEEIIAELEQELSEAEDMEMEEGEDMEMDEAKHEEEEMTQESVEAYINELLSEMEEEPIDEAEEKEDDEKDEKIEELQEELEEAYRTVKFLKNKINEVSLVNSKLLYTGKIFRSHTLNEKQKITILESFDRATSIREAKLLYTSISATLKESRSTPQPTAKKTRLKESRASKSTGSTRSAKVLQENKMVSRLQHLAGII
jgi:hypothetical protein